MYKLLLLGGLCLIMASLASSTRLVCYYNSLAENRAADGKFTISDIDPDQCTHLIYAFADINADHELFPSSDADAQSFVQFNALKVQNPKLKTLLAVGGTKVNAQRFSEMAASSLFRQRFIQSGIVTMRAFGFDGLNVDWRYPGGEGSSPEDKARFTQLCKELSEGFVFEQGVTKRDRLLSTASVSAERATIDASYDVAEIAKYLDFINVMTYDFRDTQEDATAHHSPLFKGSKDTGDKIYSNTDSALQYWRDQGTPAEKLNLGLVAYGRAFDLSSASSAVGAPASGPGEEGCYSGEQGLWSYYETCLYLEGVPIKMIADQKVPYATTENQWVGFDNKDSIETKVNYLKDNNFGGAFVWSLDLDDFSGKFCRDGNYPFISHLHTLLVPGFPSVTTTQSPNTTRTLILSTFPPTTIPTNPPTEIQTNPPTEKPTAPPTAKPLTTTTTTTTPAPTKDSGGGGGGGSGTCVDGDGRYINPDNPNSFFNCANGIAFLQFCQAGLIYKKSCDCCDFI